MISHQITLGHPKTLSEARKIKEFYQHRLAHNDLANGVILEDHSEHDMDRSDLRVVILDKEIRAGFTSVNYDSSTETVSFRGAKSATVDAELNYESAWSTPYAEREKDWRDHNRGVAQSSHIEVTGGEAAPLGTYQHERLGEGRSSWSFTSPEGQTTEYRLENQTLTILESK